MGVYETFSKRQKRLKQAGQVDVFQYDTLPEPFRIQVIYIWESALGSYERDPVAKENWQGINQLLSRERGVFTLGTPGALADTQCREFLLKADTSGALDIIELTFQVIDRKMWFSDYNRPYTSSVKQSPEEAIAELNHRFQEHGIG